jgi:hypothetical protein
VRRACPSAKFVLHGTAIEPSKGDPRLTAARLHRYAKIAAASDEEHFAILERTCRRQRASIEVWHVDGHADTFQSAYRMLDLRLVTEIA